MSNTALINTFVKARLGKYNLGPSIEKNNKRNGREKNGNN